MKRRALNKLRSRAGESLVETLVALLVSALALTMLAGAVTTATRIIEASDKKMNEYYANNNLLAQRAAPPAGSLTYEKGSFSAMMVDKEDDTKVALLTREKPSPDINCAEFNYYYNKSFVGKPVVAFESKPTPEGG